MRLPYLLLLLILVLATTSAGSARAQGAKLQPEAQVHLDAALAAYDAKDYVTAIREFDRAYAIDPRPSLLYATAQAHRFNGNCKVARALYTQYLATKPNETQTQATNVGLAACEGAPDQIPTPTPPTPAPAPPTPAKPAVTSTVDPLSRPIAISTMPGEDRRPWYKDPLGGALTIGGVVGIGVGIGFLVMASRSQARADTAEFRDDFTNALDEVTTRRRIGGIALTAGSALAVGGVLVYVFGDRRGDRAIAGGITGSSIYVAGHF